MIGDIVQSDGQEYEVVWAGRGPLLPPRDSKPAEKFEPPAKRAYKWSGRYSKVKGDHGVVVVDNPDQSTLPSADLGEL